MGSTLAMLIIVLMFGVVSCGRKGSSSKGGSPRDEHDNDDPDPVPTETPTEYFYEVNNTVLLTNFTVVAESWLTANVSIQSAQEEGKGEECYSEPTLCTYCRNEVGNSTTDLQCRDQTRQVCWSSTGCYRMTFRDLTTGDYHIEKGCWYEAFKGRYGTCNRECKKKKDGLSEVADRGGCFCEMCHGPMCNRDILLSGVGSRELSIVLGLFIVLGWGS